MRLKIKLDWEQKAWEPFQLLKPFYFAAALYNVFPLAWKTKLNLWSSLEKRNYYDLQS